MPSAGLAGRARADVDDAAAATLEHRRQRRLAADHRRAQVHRVERIPGGDVAAADLLPAKATRDVDQHVDAAKAHRDGRHRLARALHVREVGAGQQQVSRGAELSLHLGRGLRHVDQRQPRPRAGKGPRDGGPERAEGAGHDHHLRSSGFHQPPPSFSIRARSRPGRPGSFPCRSSTCRGRSGAWSRSPGRARPCACRRRASTAARR